MKKEKYIIVANWDTWNPIRIKCYESYMKDNEFNGSFKQWMNKKSSKEIMKNNLEKYLNYCKNKGIEFVYIASGLKGEKMYIELETDNKRIASHLSFQANTNMNIVNYEGYKDFKIDGHLYAV